MFSYTRPGFLVLKTQVYAVISAKYGHSVEQILKGLRVQEFF